LDIGSPAQSDAPTERRILNRWLNGDTWYDSVASCTYTARQTGLWANRRAGHHDAARRCNDGRARDDERRARSHDFHDCHDFHDWHDWHDDR
jgi:hypothetical protein